MAKLSDQQRKWLGTAIAMAAADGVLDAREQSLIVRICDVLELDAEGRAEVEQMLRKPPSPVELASWAISADDRVGLYHMAAQMAAADGEVAATERSLLDVLAEVLKLTDDERGNTAD